MSRGYIVIAQNTSTTDYLRCADILCRSIKNVMPGAHVTLLTDSPQKNGKFDGTIIFPFGDQCANSEWKLANDWQVYSASPYEYTIKLEADMYIPRSIDWWWSVLTYRDLVVATTIRDWRGDISTNRFYRKIFDDNRLPDVYNAITYFKKSSTATKFFEIVRDIFENWDEYKKIIRCYDTEIATTDVVYAIAAHILGPENCTLPWFTDMSMVHMKKHIAGTVMSDWSREMLWEVDKDVFRIGTVPQLWPVHYHVKTFADKLDAEL